MADLAQTQRDGLGVAILPQCNRAKPVQSNYMKQRTRPPSMLQILKEVLLKDEKNASSDVRTFAMSPSSVSSLAKADNYQVGGSHYQGLTPSPWEVIHAYKFTFWEGNVFKYLARWRRGKNGRVKNVADLRKAKHYLEKLIELETS